MASQSSKNGSIYDFTVKDARGNDVDLSIYKGKVLLIVNVASQCIQWGAIKAALLKLEPVTKDEYYKLNH
ncbi:hypothetical protein L1049_007246 [Liquidambar formosana]|uniref:Glutathione peroxidase n=1 Tax=Liquidambar formosana TaxID=63359 RepID=A0AAP0RGV5_LIQFO